MSVSTAIDFGDAPAPQRHPADLSGTAATPRRLLYVLFAIQALSATFFLADLWSEVFGLRHTALPYEVQEIIEIGASIGLLAGMFTSAYVLSISFRRVTALSRQVDVAAGNFQAHLEAVFAEWELSPSEKAVTIFVMKGFSNAEVAAFRGTSASTVKTQLNAVYRKSGCANRQQLISFLVEELMSGVAVD